MARALHDDNVFTVGRAVEGPADTVLELGADDLGVLEIVLSELWSDGHGRHGGDRNIEIEKSLDEQGVFVDLVIA